MKVLVIGGTRFIGTFVIEQLLDKGHDVALFHRGNHQVPYENITSIKGDREDLLEYKEKFKSYNPDIVLDMIPLTQKHAKDVIETFKDITQRIIAISSGDVYQAFGRLIGTERSQPNNEIITESSPLRQNLYPFKKVKGRENYEKILVEEELMASPEVHTTILRLPMVYGPKDYQHRLFKYIKRMKDNRPFILLDEDFGNFKWTKGYVENIAAGIVLALEHNSPKNRIYNIGEKETVTMKQWVEEIGNQFGWKGKVINVNKDHLPEKLQDKGNTEQLMVVDSSAIRKELGYSEPVSYSNSLKKTIEWELSNPPEYEEEDFNYKEEEEEILSRISI